MYLCSFTDTFSSNKIKALEVFICFCRGCAILQKQFYNTNSTESICEYLCT